MFKLRRMLGVLCFHYFTVFLIIPSLIHTHTHTHLIFYLFSESGEGTVREQERNINVREKNQLAASHMPPTRDLALNRGPSPD